jgi:hypothetical protein
MANEHKVRKSRDPSSNPSKNCGSSTAVVLSLVSQPRDGHSLEGGPEERAPVHWLHHYVYGDSRSSACLFRASPPSCKRGDPRGPEVPENWDLAALFPLPLPPPASASGEDPEGTHAIEARTPVPPDSPCLVEVPYEVEAHIILPPCEAHTASRSGST